MGVKKAPSIATENVAAGFKPEFETLELGPLADVKPGSVDAAAANEVETIEAASEKTINRKRIIWYFDCLLLNWKPS